MCGGRGRGVIGYYHRSSKGLVKPLDAAIADSSQVHHIGTLPKCSEPQHTVQKLIVISNKFPRTFDSILLSYVIDGYLKCLKK